MTALDASAGGYRATSRAATKIVIYTLAACGIVLAYGTLTGVTWFAIPAILVLVLGLAAGVVHTTARTQDPFNPLTIIVILTCARIGVPYLLSYFSQPPTTFRWMTSVFEYRVEGLLLALSSMAAIVTGWCWCPQAWRRRLRVSSVWRYFRIDNHTVVLAAVFVLVGLGLILVFFSANYADPLGAIQTGVVRDQSLRAEGTSRYRFLGDGLLVAGALTMAVYYLQRGKSLYVASIPAIGAFAILATFGQRIGATAPLVFFIGFWWYRRQRETRWIRVGLAVVVGVAAFVIYAAFLVAYRGGGGVGAGLRALSSGPLVHYLHFSAWYEFGFLHPFSAAAQYGPGVLRGQTVPALGGFVTEVFLGIESVKPGLFIVQNELNHLQTWGIHTGLAVDTYMNWGFFATIASSIAFGAVVRLSYVALVRDPTDGSDGRRLIFMVVLWHLLWTYYESMANVFALLISVGFFSALLFASHLSPVRPTARPRGAQS